MTTEYICSFFSVSVCKNGLILESGIPVVLPLYPGDCSPSNETTDSTLNKTQQTNEIPTNSSENTFIPLEPIKKFIPTPVVRIGNEAIKPHHKLEDRTDKTEDKNSVFYSWTPLSEHDSRNELDSSEEVESTRALNTKIVRTRKQTTVENVVEVVEPVLKKNVNKNARSHNIDKPEITEPILGPTTAKVVGLTTKKPISLTGITDKPNFDYYINSESEWVPSRRAQDGKNLKRHDDSYTDENKNENPLKMIMMTVQFLPERLSKMFEQAEKYARETIFPLISQHTPRFISNFISPRPQTQYVPLEFVDTSTTDKENEVVSPKTDFNPPNVPLKLERTDPDIDNSTDIVEDKEVARSSSSVEEKLKVIYPEKRIDEDITSMSSSHKIPPDSKVYYDSPVEEVGLGPKGKKLFVDLPVFDERDRGIKYIPLSYPDALSDSEKITKR